MKSLPLAAYWERDAAAQAVRLALPMLEAARADTRVGESGFLHVVVMNPLARPGEAQTPARVPATAAGRAGSPGAKVAPPALRPLTLTSCPKAASVSDCRSFSTMAARSSRCCSACCSAASACWWPTTSYALPTPAP